MPAQPKTGYKFVPWLFKTELEIPESWNFFPIDELSTNVGSGIWGDEPTPEIQSYPVVRSTEITHDNKIDASTVAYRVIDKTKIEKYVLKLGDLLIVASSGSSHLIGRTAFFEASEQNKKYLFSNFLIRLRPHNIVAKYLYYCLNSNEYKHFLTTFQETTTGLRNFPKKEFLKLRISFPSTTDEQNKIIRILSNVDYAIQNTNQLIEQTRLLKRGILQKLITEGIGHTKFKKLKWYFKKEIKIPSQWNVLSLKDVSINGLQNGVFKKPSEFGSGTSLVNVFDLYSERKINLNNLQRVQISDSELDKYRVFDDDIFFDRSSLVLEGIGQSNIIFGLSEPTVFECHVMRLRPNEQILPKFLFYYTRTHLFKQYIVSIAKTATMTTISQPDLEKARILIPSLPEQKQIVSIISNIDLRIEREELNKSNLELLKKSQLFGRLSLVCLKCLH